MKSQIFVQEKYIQLTKFNLYI